ncbi:hypothetical protein [Pontibacter qinzhouensis]|nr:hypothetical protein [Pontibacter qinzhouensis]
MLHFKAGYLVSIDQVKAPLQPIYARDSTEKWYFFYPAQHRQLTD